MLGELTAAGIEALLSDNYIGRIACGGNGTPLYIVPVNYRYMDNHVQCYSLEGEKIRIMRKHPEVCFEVEELQDPTHWKTVIAWGRYEEVSDEAELELLRPQYSEYLLRMRASLTALPTHENTNDWKPEANPAAPVFYRIRFTRLSGRFEKGF